MGRLSERLEIAEKALERLEELLRIYEPSAVERDAAIQRFEFTFEAVWKAAKDFLFEHEGIDAGSPKRVIRACRESGLINEFETVQALQMADDRNLTVHTYNESLAEAIYQHIKDYAPILRLWLSRMN